MRLDSGAGVDACGTGFEWLSESQFLNQCRLASFEVKDMVLPTAMAV